MGRITYIHSARGIQVYLDGRRTGAIRTSVTKRGTVGWAYFPKGEAKGGRAYDTLAEVKGEAKGGRAYDTLAEVKGSLEVGPPRPVDIV